MINLYELYPDLKKFDSFILRYTIKDIDGNTVKAYARDDLQSGWEDITEAVLKQEEIKRIELELRKLELRERLAKHNVEENNADLQGCNEPEVDF